MDVLPHLAADAVENMAMNQLLLDHYPTPMNLRIRPFSWSKPAFTFGVSQAWSQHRAFVDTQVELVRRCTGGGLVSHINDWTFALVIPPSHILYQSSSTATYFSVHTALLNALRLQNMPVKLAPTPIGVRQFQAPTHCALRAEPNDLIRIDNGNKVAGAAQKRNKNGLLIEGYIWKPFLDGCDWSLFQNDFFADLGYILKSNPNSTITPVYDPLHRNAVIAKFASKEWNERF